MKTLKRLLPIFIILVMLFSLFSLETFADPISFIGFASAMDAYGMAYGVGTTYDVTNSQGITDSFDGLWDQFSAYQTTNNAELPTIGGQSYSYDQYIDEWQENYRSVKADELTHSSGKFASFYIDEESASVFDQFWNWLLSGPAELVKADNQYQWNVDSNTNEIITPKVFSGNAMYPSQPIPYRTLSGNDATDFANGFFPGYFYNTSNGSSVPCAVICTSGNSTYCVSVNNRLYFLSNYNATVRCIRNYATNRYTAQDYTLSQIPNETIYSVSAWPISANKPIYVPQYTSITDAINDFRTYISNESSYLTGITLKPISEDGEEQLPITIPDITDPDYTPSAVTIVTNAPWDDSYDDEDTDNSSGLPVPYPTNTIPDIIDNISDKMVDDGFSIENDPQPDDPDPPPPAPSEVFYPLLPVAAPSFNFNFSGIWHYVREWVSSLGAWFSLVFTVWSYLPYAIVVPVYATAVIVIVLGVYKRFFM